MTRVQIIRSAVFGIVFWFMAAMTVKLLAPYFDGGSANAVILAASIPFAWLSIPIGLWAAGAPTREAIHVNVVAIIAAALLDGIGITYFAPLLYAGVSPASQFGAAFILWGVGWILIFAWVKARAA